MDQQGWAHQGSGNIIPTNQTYVSDEGNNCVPSLTPMHNQGRVHQGSDNIIPTNQAYVSDEGNNGVPSLAPPMNHQGGVHQGNDNIISTNQTNVSDERNNGVSSLAPPMNHEGRVHQGSDNIIPTNQTYVSYEGNNGVPSLGYIRNFQIPLQPPMIAVSNMLEIPVIASNQSYVFRHENVEYWGNDWLFSMGYIRNFQIPSQPPLFFQYDCPPFSIMVEIPFGTSPQMQPFVNIPAQSLQPSPWINIMWPSTLPSSFLPAYTVNSGEAVAPFNNSRNIMADPPTSLGNVVQGVTNLSSPNQTLNVSGYVPFLSNYGPINGIHVYHAPPWATGPQYPPRTAVAQIGSWPFNEMGNESGGLSEEDILMHLRQEKFQSVVAGTSGTDECCCICQDDYADGDVLGKLKCLHKYHFSCIKQWLVRNNTCPVCRQTALTVARP